MADKILIGSSAKGESFLFLKRANRHGLIAGATGTGKTVTLQRIAENFADHGISVFAVDIKGDLSGIAMNKDSGNARSMVAFWDVLQQQGHPVRTTITEYGPILLSRLLDLNETQSAVMDIVFRTADEQGLVLVDLKDLKAILNYVAENAKEISSEYGLVSPTTIAAIQRAVLSFENDGADFFFGEPVLEVRDLIRCDENGKGLINILAANQLMQRPRLYASFLLWLLAELYEDLPEVGDLPKPKLALFFDEAHLIFNDIPKVLLEKLEQVVRLIRSKGVGVYFITQNPMDIPDSVLAQLSNRLQHALRAYTPNEQKAVRAAAQSFRANPAFDTESAITALGVGEALVSVLDEAGVPTMVEKVKVLLPQSRLGALSDIERKGLMSMSIFAGRYDQAIDRESAFERLQQRAQLANTAQTQVEPQQATGTGGGVWDMMTSPSRQTAARGNNRQSMGEAMAKSVIRSVGSSVGRQIGNKIIRGILGAVLR